MRRSEHHDEAAVRGEAALELVDVVAGYGEAPAVIDHLDLTVEGPGLVQILGTGVNGTFVVPEMIVVAIPNTNRTRDMTPTRADRDPAGKPAPAFASSGGAGGGDDAAARP